MSVEFPYGRLFVGWRGSNWTKCYYEPEEVDLQLAIESNSCPPLSIYNKPRGDAPPEAITPGQINWLPHFDYRNFEASDFRARASMQRWFVYRCWEHLKTKDNSINAVIERNDFAKGGKNQRWESWVYYANQWRRRHPRGPDDDSDTDDGYESGDDGPDDGSPPPMGPPRRPAAPRRRVTNTRAGGAQQAPRKRKRSQAGGQGSNDTTMSGGLGSNAGIRASTGSSTRVDDLSDDEDDEDDNDDFSVRHPTPLDRGTWNFDGIRQNPTPTSGRRRTGQLGNLTFDGTGLSGLRLNNNARHDSEEELPDAEERRRNVHEYNGDGMDEEEALRISMRNSMASGESNGNNNSNGDGADDDQALEEGLRASMAREEPQGHGDGVQQVRQSIEDAGDEEQGDDGGD